MAEINIVVLRPIEKKFLEQIAGIDPRLKIFDASGYASPGESRDFLADKRFDAMLAQAEVICGFWPPKDLLTRAPKLKWYHCMLAGVDFPGFAEIMQSQVILSNSTGIHGVQMSELAFTLMLNLAKRIPQFYKLQQEKKWLSDMPQVLEGKTLGVLGLGNIGTAVARLGHAFGMRVIALEASAAKRQAGVPGVEKMYPPQDLPLLLSESDFVVVTLPATAETNQLLGEKEFKAMKKSAYIINMARGKIINEAALVRALKENWIAGAGLDVVEKEPLPSNSELWELPNVIITPHVGGRRSDYNNLAVPLFCENLKRYLNQETLINLVNKNKGF